MRIERGRGELISLPTYFFLTNRTINPDLKSKIVSEKASNFFKWFLHVITSILFYVTLAETCHGKVKIQVYSICCWNSLLFVPFFQRDILKVRNWSISQSKDRLTTQSLSTQTTEHRFYYFNLWAFLNGYETVIPNSFYMIFFFIIFKIKGCLFLMHAKYW